MEDNIYLIFMKATLVAVGVVLLTFICALSICFLLFLIGGII